MRRNHLFLSQDSQNKRSRALRQRSDAAGRRRRLFLERLEDRSLLAEVGSGLSALADSYTVDEDQSLTIAAAGVLANDPDATSGALALLIGSGTQHGNLQLAQDGGFTYDPELDFFGIDTFQYQLVNGSLSSPYITVTITVASINDAPVAIADAFDMDEDPLWFEANVLANDSDIDGDSLLVSLVTGVAHGGVILNGDGAFNYTPNINYNGTDSFTYLAYDGTDYSQPATVTLTVNPVNDAPSFTASAPPAVNEDAGAQTLNNWAMFNPGASNESTQLATYIVSNVSNLGLFAVAPSVAADGTLTYTPAPDAFGTSTFDVTVQDSGGTVNGGVDVSSTQTFTITVNAVAPKLSINNVTATEAAGAELTFEVTLDADANGPFTVDFTTFKLSAEDAPTLHAVPGGIDLPTQDYFAKNGTLTSTGAKGVIGRITISLTNDNMAELTETLQVDLSNIQSADPAIPSNVAFADYVGDGTINDDDVIHADFFNRPPFPTTEGTGANTQFLLPVTLWRSAPVLAWFVRADGPITITYVIEDKTTAAPSIPGTLNASPNDYVDVTGGTLIVPAYSMSPMIQIDLVGDRTVEELLESFNVVITSISAGGRPATFAPPNAGGAANIEISDDDKARVVFSQTPPFFVSETADDVYNAGPHQSYPVRTVTVNVRLTAPVEIPFPFTVDVYTKTPFAPPPAFNPATSSATINTPWSQIDYIYKLETFIFSGAVPQQFNFDIQIMDDNIAESIEMFAVGITVNGLTSPRDVKAGPDLPVEIRDNDVAVVSIQNKRIRETDAGGLTVGAVGYTVSQPSDSAITFTINDTPGTAVAGTDYNAAIYPLTVTIPPNTTSGTFDVSIFNDTTYTGDRTFTLTATGATPPLGTTNNVSISPTNGTATIGIEEDEWWWE